MNVEKALRGQIKELEKTITSMEGEKEKET
jgi:hypothetical protein